MKVTAYGIDYDCDKAVKGNKSIKLYNDGTCIASFEGISDFSGYSISGGEWSDPDPSEIDYLLELDFRLSMVELGLQGGV